MVSLLALLILYSSSVSNDCVMADMNNGQWRPTEVVSTESTDDSNNPAIAVDSQNNVHVVWHDFTDYDGSGTDTDIFYKYYNQATASWTLTQVISTESTGGSAYPSIAIDSHDNVHVVWQDTTDYQGSGIDVDVFYKYYDRATSSWTSTQVVSTESATNSDDPRIAIDSNDNLHVVWYDFTDYGGSGSDPDIFYKIFSQETSTWSVTQVVSSESTLASNFPAITVDSNDNVHVAWHDLTDYSGAGVDYDIFYKYYTPATSTWSVTQVISTEGSSSSLYPSITSDNNNNIHIVWHDQADYNGAGTDSDIFYKYFDQATATWSSTIVVSTQSTSSSYFSIVRTDNQDNVHFVWYDITNLNGAGTDTDVFHRVFYPQSVTWSRYDEISYNNGTSARPNIDIDASGRIHIVWDDQTNYNGAGSEYDIFYRVYEKAPDSPQIQLLNQGPVLSSIGLSWEPIPFVTSYNIYRTNATISEAKKIGSTIDTVYVDTSTEEDAYSYYVTATNVVGESPRSNIILVSISRDTVSVTQSNNLTSLVSILGENITVSHKSGGNFVPISEVAGVAGIVFVVLIIRFKRYEKKN